MATISNTIMKNIIKDIHNGVFAQPDMTTVEFYGENDNIEVRADIGLHFNLLDFSVIVTEENGDESYLCDEQLIELEDELVVSLREAEDDAKSEAEFERYLWNNCA